jgi:hypothetical protein
VIETRDKPDVFHIRNQDAFPVYEQSALPEEPIVVEKPGNYPGNVDLGSILQNSISAEKFSDKFSS